MKKISLFLFCLMSVIGIASAEETTIDFSSATLTNDQYTSSDKMVTIERTGAGSAVITGGALRFSAGDELAILVDPDEAYITSISITPVGDYEWNGIKIDGATAADIKNLTTPKVWNFTDEQAEKVLENTGATEVRIKSITVTYTLIPKPIENVKITFTEKLGIGTVTLSCPTSGVTIKYGFSKDNLDQTYSKRFTVNESCTVYAQAQMPGATSEITSKVIDLPVRYESLGALVANAKNATTAYGVGNFEVIAKSGNYVLITDGTDNALLNGANTCAVGDMISAVKGNIVTVDGLVEVQKFTLTTGTVEVTAPDFAEVSLSDFASQAPYAGLTLKGGEISNGNTLSVDGETLTLNNVFYSSIKNGNVISMNGYKWGDQFAPVEIEYETATVETPVITPTVREVADGVEIAISCATEGATIYYTTDGTEPTAESTAYTAPFAISFGENESVTVQAFAVAAEMKDSEVASRVYYKSNPAVNVISADDQELASYFTTPYTMTVDGVDYTMLVALDPQKGIEMNGADYLSYIFQSSANEEYVIDSVVVEYAGDSNATFGVRGANTEFTGREYGTTAGKVVVKTPGNVESNGDLVGSISSSSTTVSFEKDYKYFSLYTTNNIDSYLKSVTVNYRAAKADEAPALPENITFDTQSGLSFTTDLDADSNWKAKFQVMNGDEEVSEVLDYDYGINEGYFDGTLAPATLFTINLWFENEVTEGTSEVKGYSLLTKPSFTLEDGNSEEQLIFDFGTIGEGVTVYFTIDGSNPVIPTEDAPASAPKKATSADGVLTLDDAADYSATHAITSATPTVKILPGATTEAVTIKAQAKDGDITSEVSTGRDNVATAIKFVVNDSEAEYYTLDGVKFNGNLNKGLYLVRKNGKVSKIMVK